MPETVEFSLRIGFDVEENVVMVEFRQPTSFFTMDPDNAEAIAKEILQYVARLRAGKLQ